MIRSYVSEIGRDIFEGNWAPLVRQRSLEPIEDCFIDLRILDAAAAEKDILQAFQGRLVKSNSSNSKGDYCVHQPASSSFAYRIDFVWTGDNVEAVNVTLSPPEINARVQ